MINEYLRRMPFETGQILYNLLGYLQYPAFVAILLWATFRYKIPAKHKAVLWVAFVISRLWLMVMLPVVGRLTHDIIPANFGIGFVLFMLPMAVIAYSMHTPVLFTLDVAVPAFILGRGLAITGCIFYGCCHGFPVSWGIYSGAAKTLTFPTVVLDILISCGVVGYLMLLSRKQKFSGNGTAAANGMILFGLLRVLIDLLRDNEKIFFLLTFEGVFGIAYVVGGYLLLRHIYHKR